MQLIKLKKYKELRKHELSELEIQVLVDIKDYLAFFHVVQEEVSAQKTPTLSVVLLLYEQLIQHLKNAKQLLPCLSHAMDTSIKKLNEYLAQSWKSCIYALAIGMYLSFISTPDLFTYKAVTVLNPTLKFEWIEQHWKADEARAA